MDSAPSRWARLRDNDVFHSFLHSPGAMLAALIAVSAIVACFAAPLIAPYNPFDPAQISLWDGKLPPAWVEGGDSRYLLGTDNQGRDMLSTLLYGGRISITVGIAAVLMGMVLGVGLGVLSGYLGGTVDTVIMRLADVQLTIPGILLRIRPGGAHHRPGQLHHHAAPHPAQHPAAGVGDRDHRPRARDHLRGHPELSRPGYSADYAVTRHPDPRRQ